MCDGSKEPYGFTDHKSKKKTKKYWNLTKWISKIFFLDKNSQSFQNKTGYLANKSVKYQFFCVQICDQWIYTVLWSYRTFNSDDSFFDLTRVGFWKIEISKSSKKFDIFISFLKHDYCCVYLLMSIKKIKMTPSNVYICFWNQQ